MIKKMLTLLLVIISYLGVFAQNPVTGLVTTNSDVIGLTDYPTAPLIIQAGPENFYWIGGSYQGTTVEHPMLNDKVVSDFSNIYFIKYDKMGNPLASAVISGTNIIPSAFSLEGGMTIVGNASEDVVANGNSIPINAANRLEFIAKYNDLCQFDRIVPIWDLEPSQYPNSRAMMDPESGELFLAGVSHQPYNLLGHGIIGKEMNDYLYVLKYDRNLALTGVFTAGFDELDSEYGYYSNLRITPGGNGSVVISGVWQGDRTPVIDGHILSKMINSQGTFAFKLDREFKTEWVLEGTLEGTDYDAFSGISEGKALSNGDLVMMGATSTGHFSLGEIKIEFENGAGFNNMFAFRISPEGSVSWIRPLENRDEAYDMGKKGTNSEEFTTYINRDAIYWKDEVLYLTGKFSGDLFEVAGRPLENKLGKGAFVAAIDMRSGEEMWGYALSSNRIDLSGFDLDGSGNVTLMGKTGSMQEYEGIGPVSVDGTDLVFHLGLDNQGKPLWYNNAYLSSLGFNNYACDLEVLQDGEVFSTLYKTVPDPLLIGEESLTAKEVYSTILVALSADNVIGGKVTDKSGNPLYPGVVRAYKVTNIGAYPIVQTVNIDDSGAYLFTGLVPGNYAFRVIPDINAFPDGMPTYSGGGITWGATQTGVYDVAPDTRATFLDISLSHLDPLTELDGSGQMSGVINYADDFIAKGTQARPVTGTSVILKKKAASKGTQEDDIVAYIETDEFGNYYFNFIPDGEYNMIIDIPGLPMVENYDVDIVDNTIVGELDFVVENDGIYTPSTGVKSIEMKLVSLYPNPGNGNLHLEFRKSGDYRVRVFNTVGKMLEYKNYLSVSGTMDLDLSELDSGIYLIKIEGDRDTETIKYIRN
ncbi:MAG: T9SS type A sorting domain-containing protein [Bacteroides sp.]|nr:T9SS type A sorting domain-containing protein [Bacteroides sp.]